MKKRQQLLLALLLPCLLTACVSSKKTFNIFNVRISPKDIVGGGDFNDIGLKYSTTVINNMTDDTTTYLWRLGTVRINPNYFQDGNYSLFDLSTSSNLDGYPILDLIDFTYYKERGFQILETKNPTILADPKYLLFKKNISDPLIDNKKRRAILWDDDNRLYRSELLGTRYFINKQPITFNKKTIKNIRASLQSSIKTEIKNLAKIASDLKDSTSQNKVNSASVEAYFNSLTNQTLDLQGVFISAIFQNEYTNRANYIISNINSSDAMATGNDEFSRNFRKYTKEDTVALNSGIIAFQLKGGLNKTSVSKDSIRVNLQALFHIPASQAAALANTASFTYSKSIDITLKNQFSKVWIIKFGTDGNLNILKFNNEKAYNKGNVPKK